MLTEPKETLPVADWDSGKHTGAGCLREICHQKGIPHFSAELWAVCTDQSTHQILLQKRSPHKINFPGMYDAFIGGHLTGNESPLDCLVREAVEEAGVTVSPEECRYFCSRRYFLQQADYLDREWLSHYIWMTSWSILKHRLEPGEEVQGFGLFNLTDLKKLFFGELNVIDGTFFEKHVGTKVHVGKNDFTAFTNEKKFWTDFTEFVKGFTN